MFVMTGPWARFKHFIGAFLPSGWIMDEDTEKAFYPISKLMKFMAQESGYFHIQATKPDTVGTIGSQSNFEAPFS